MKTMKELRQYVIIILILIPLCIFISIVAIRDGEGWVGIFFGFIIFVNIIIAYYKYIKIKEEKLYKPINKTKIDSKLEEELSKQTGDPAFLHKVNSITANGKKDFKTEPNKSESKHHNIESLIKKLGSEDQDVREEARKNIVSIGESALEPLLEALKSNTWNIRMSAAMALGEIGDSSAVEPLLKGLQENIRIQSIISLGKIGDKRAEKSLFDALKDNVANCRGFAAVALYNMGHIDPFLNAFDDNNDVLNIVVNALPEKPDPRIIAALSRPLQNAQDWLTRFVIATKLGEIGDINAEKALTDALNDDNEMVRGAAQASLKKIREKS